MKQGAEETQYPRPASWLGHLPPEAGKPNLAYAVLCHQYVGGPTGWMETLEVVGDDIPSGHERYLTYRRPSSTHSEFVEWGSLATAKQAFDQYLDTMLARHQVYADERRAAGCSETPTTWSAPFPHYPGFVRQVACGALRPWFYAMVGERLRGDYVATEVEQGRVQRLFVMGELWAGSNGMPCEACKQQQPDSDPERTFSVLLGPEDNALIHKLDGPEAARTILEQRLGHVLCMRHMMDHLDPTDTLLYGMPIPDMVVISMARKTVDGDGPTAMG